jgi:hypothetical protein
VFRSDPVTLGTLTATSTGTIGGSFTIPSNAAVGSHTIELTGTGIDNAARTVSISVTVLSSTVVTVDQLQRTGADSWPLAGTGLLLIAIGAGLALAARADRRGGHYA